MKRILTAIIFLFTSTSLVFAQSIIIKDHKTHEDVTGKTINLTVDKGEKNNFELSITNKTGNLLRYSIIRTILNPPMKDCGGVYFCTGTKCYSPDTATEWESPDSDTLLLKPNETLPDPTDTNSYGIAAHYDVCQDACQDLTILYKIYLLSNPNDFSLVTIKYTCATGIWEEQAALGSLSNAFPNPTNSNFTVDYSSLSFEASRIEVCDLFGKKWIEIPLRKNEGSININTSSLKPGIYFYTLMIGNQRAATKQLVIRE